MNIIVFIIYILKIIIKFIKIFFKYYLNLLIFLLYFMSRKERLAAEYLDLKKKLLVKVASFFHLNFDQY